MYYSPVFLHVSYGKATFVCVYKNTCLYKFVVFIFITHKPAVHKLKVGWYLLKEEKWLKTKPIVQT